jgi:hypothetical protein
MALTDCGTDWSDSSTRRALTVISSICAKAGTAGQTTNRTLGNVDSSAAANDRLLMDIPQQSAELVLCTGAVPAPYQVR